MATITGLLAAASMMPVTVVTGSETRPSTTARVLWIGGTAKPTFMIDGDIWFRVQTTGPSLPEFVTTSLGTVTQNVAYSKTLILNGTSPFTFTVTAGTLPAGLTIHSTTGTVSGTPTAATSYSFSVRATNAVGNTTQTFTGTVSASAVIPVITTTTLSSLTQGTVFSQTLQATGTTPMTWTISAGTLPSGLTLNSSNGTITGTPTGSGAYSFTVQASNTAGLDTQAYTGTIAATGTAPTITTTALDALVVGTPFSQTLNKTGSTPMTWGVSAGTIPGGLTINSSTGTISGNPTTAASYSFTVQATNSFGSDTQVYTGSVTGSGPTDIYSIFGLTNPGSLTSYSDGVVGGWQTHQYYQSTSIGALPTGTKIIGARLYLPVGSAHIGQAWKAATYLNPGSYINSAATIDTTATFNAAASKVNGATLVQGWNEVLFPAEYDVVPQSGSWLIGTMIGNGTLYLYDTSVTSAEIQNPQGKNFFLAPRETGSVPIPRSLYLAGTSTAAWYGVDVIMRVP